MNILYLIGSLGNGGKERLVRDVMEMRNSLPYRAWCICRKEPAQCNGAILMPSRRIFHFLRSLRKMVRSNQIQLIHAQSAFDASLASLATLGLGTPVVQTFHSYEFATKIRFRLMERFAFGLCTRSVFVSREQMQHFATIHRLTLQQQRKQALVYNGVNFSRFPLTIRKSNPRLQMAMVGNFVPEKNQLFVLEFLEDLNAQNVDFEFYFIGERKPQFPLCYDRCIKYCEQKGLSNKVHFLGKREDVPQLLEKMDAFVYCSRSETFGLAVVEAIATGLPVFVNDLPVFGEITQEGRLATLYATDNLQQLCDKFAHFLSHHQESNSLAAESAREIRNAYSILAHTNNLYSLYSQIIAKK